MADISKTLNYAEQQTLINELLDDVTALRSALTTLTAKLDTDFTAQNGAVTASQLDVDYATAVNPPALKTVQ